ncbi:GDSL esterase/lipase At3g09930-like [Panicum virgatum]|uniref:GDSL esterase/lipase At3g09930-like n=1 Tax=Panicum virgatum TaxID=38727 RepID=UPI0019D56A09|nr:GDSL esterase/lipase At3g09930-like [Panicum virgatum]
MGGAGVFEVPHKAPTLTKQIDSFKKMLDGDDIGKWLLRESVALVAIFGNDYARVANMSDESEILDFIGNVTGEIAAGVERLRKLGVTRVLVNNLHPLACTSWQTRPSNYTECMGRGNLATFFHNGDLEKKLNASSSDNVYLVDLHRAFTNIVDPSDPQDSHVAGL